MPRTIGAYILAVVVTAALATMVQTQFNLGFLQAMGVPVPFGVRLETTLFDLAGLGPTLALVMAAALLIAFLIAAGIIHFLPRLRMLGYILSGAAAMTAALLSMEMMFGFPPLAAARPLAGFLAMVAAGAAGGLVFAILSRQQGETHHDHPIHRHGDRRDAGRHDGGAGHGRGQAAHTQGHHGG